MGGAAYPPAPGDPDAVGRDAERELRRRLERLRPGAAGPGRGLRFAVYAATAGVLVLPTVLLVLPWLDRALTIWPL